MPGKADRSPILAVNGGSSSLKFALFEPADPPRRLESGRVERIGLPGARMVVSDAEGRRSDDRPVDAPDHAAAAGLLIDWLGGRGGVAAVGHRLVHGGGRFYRPERVTPEMLDELRRMSPLDPDHLPAEIGLIEAFGRLDPGLPQVACFDTAFHHDLPRVARIVPIPRRYEAAGVRRYGFHGLSYQYLMGELERVAGPEAARGRLILAHLGAGASLAAVREGRPVETTMGFTPASGLVMATRSGDLDPGLVGYLARTEGMTPDRFNAMVNRESGLLGVSETGGDLRDLLAVEGEDVRAAEAIALFCYRVKAAIGSLAAALGGLDTLVFAGGIGENSAEARRRICDGLRFLGIALDEARNASHAPLISADGRPASARVIRTDEESMIARQAFAVLGEPPGQGPTTEPTLSATALPTDLLGPNDTPPDLLRAFGPARSTIQGSPLGPEELRRIDQYWRASLYLCVGMIYLKDNPLLRQPLTIENIKARLLGHWGSDPGQSFAYTHLNRLIRRDDLDMIFVSGPGHGAPAVLSQAYLEGTYSEVYPDKSEDVDGMRRFFRQFSFPGGIGSHATPEVPGSIHEGGELGYSVSHAYGAAFDNPDLIVAVIVGDGEAETASLATSWHSNKFLNPIVDGAVLPILHLNGYKINNPTILARIGRDELESLFLGYGYTPYFVEGSEPESMHQAMAATLEHCVGEIRAIQAEARRTGVATRPRWPVVILRSPKGWTDPSEVDGHKMEGSWRSHQVPVTDVIGDPAHLKVLETWMRSYHPEDLFDEGGRLIPELKALAPVGPRRMSANPVANGGLVRRTLEMPDYRGYAVPVKHPGTTEVENVRPLGDMLRDVMRRNPHNFRVFGPDENTSNKLTALYEATKKTWLAATFPEDADGGELAPDGRVMEMLSENTLEGWLEGYLLTGRHGFFSTYESFVHVIDSMINQHCKWLEKANELAWRAKVASVNLLITSLVWRQDHNGFTHQDPGFLDVVANKSPDVTRIYLPPDANCLLSVADHCLRSVQYVNVIVADKQSHLQYLDIDAAVKHCTKGVGIWDWASNDDGVEPDAVMVGCGDIPTMEALAATDILRRSFPDLKLRFVNVVDLFKLVPHTEHPHGLTDREFDSLFTTNKPVIFNFHGYPWLIHRLTYRRKISNDLHVRGYKEKGNINTPLDLAILNQVDRFSLAMDVIDRVPRLHVAGAHVREHLRNEQIDCSRYAHEFGVDKPEILKWRWGKPPAV